MISSSGSKMFNIILHKLHYTITAIVKALLHNQTNEQTNNNDLLEKDGGTNNCIYKD